MWFLFWNGLTWFGQVEVDVGLSCWSEVSHSHLISHGLPNNVTALVSESWSLISLLLRYPFSYKLSCRSKHVYCDVLVMVAVLTQHSSTPASSVPGTDLLCADAGARLGFTDSGGGEGEVPLPSAFLPAAASETETGEGAASSPAFTFSRVWPCESCICPADMGDDGCGSQGVWGAVNPHQHPCVSRSISHRPRCQIIVFTGVLSSSWRRADWFTHSVMHDLRKCSKLKQLGSEAAKDLKHSCAGKALQLETYQYMEESCACAHTS